MTIKSSLSMAGAVALALGGASLAMAQYPATSSPPATAMPPATSMPAKTTMPMNAPSMATTMTTAGHKANMSNTMHSNLSKSRIREIQKALRGLGYYLQVDGVWGQGTIDDIKDVQFKNGLTVTGKPDANTLRALGLQGGANGQPSSGMHHAPMPSTHSMRNTRMRHTNSPAMYTGMAPSQMTMSPAMGTS